jgi:hypothetical protein
LKNAVFWDVMPFGALVRTEVLEERIASIIMVAKISNWVILTPVQWLALSFGRNPAWRDKDSHTSNWCRCQE